jgi:hypothetical protein
MKLHPHRESLMSDGFRRTCVRRTELDRFLIDAVDRDRAGRASDGDDELAARAGGKDSSPRTSSSQHRSEQPAFIDRLR